jgi:hypothetical protein
MDVVDSIRENNCERVFLAQRFTAKALLLMWVHGG